MGLGIDMRICAALEKKRMTKRDGTHFEDQGNGA